MRPSYGAVALFISPCAAGCCVHRARRERAVYPWAAGPPHYSVRLVLQALTSLVRAPWSKPTRAEDGRSGPLSALANDEKIGVEKPGATAALFAAVLPSERPRLQTAQPWHHRREDFRPPLLGGGTKDQGPGPHRRQHAGPRASNRPPGRARARRARRRSASPRSRASRPPSRRP